MRNPHINYRWPVSLYWTLMLSVPVAGLLVASGYCAAWYVVQYFLAR